MPNNDYILRSDALEHFGNYLSGYSIQKDDVIRGIEELPAADVEPKRKPGRWIKLSSADDGYCSECGFAFLANQDGEPPMFGDGFNRREERWSCYPGITSAQNLLKICPCCGSPMLPEPPKGEDNAEEQTT